MPHTPAPTPALQNERRRSPRRRVLVGGKIVLPGGQAFDCTIHDLSEGGARIRTPPERDLPDELILIDLKAGILYLAAVRWREPPWVGVKLVVRQDLRGPLPAALVHLRRLWHDGLAKAPPAAPVGDGSPQSGARADPPFSREGW